MEKIGVPIGWVDGTGDAGPGLCARHGEPAEVAQSVEFRPRVPRWVWVAAIPLAVVVAVLARKVGVLVAPLLLLPLALERKYLPRLTVSAWPFCARCGRLARWRLVGVTLGTVGVVAGVLAVLRLATGGVDGTGLALLAGAVLLMVAGIVLREAYSWRRLAGGYVAKGRQSIEVPAHDRFAAAVRGRFVYRPMR